MYRNRSIVVAKNRVTSTRNNTRLKKPHKKGFSSKSVCAMFSNKTYSNRSNSKRKTNKDASSRFTQHVGAAIFKLLERQVTLQVASVFGNLLPLFA